MLVDDDESLRQALSKNLQRLGHQVTPAENGKLALDLFQSQKFDLVISDIRMPEMDGIELTKRLRKDSKVPLILITGFSDLLETQEAHRLGANEFLPKPFERVDLELAIDRCLKTSAPAESPTEYAKLSIADFLTGRQIQFNIFLMLPTGKFVKIAHKGEDLSRDRIRAYEGKGIHHLYLLREDFRKYLGFSLNLNKAAQTDARVTKEKKLQLAKHTAEVLMIHIGSHGLDSETFQETASFLQTTMDVISDDPQILGLLEMLRHHSEFHYAHSVGVGFYGAALAKFVGWQLPSNRLKVAMSGLLHDVGEKEISLEILSRPRYTWSVADVKIYEGHALRGVEILSSVASISHDVIQVVREHHEDCQAQGFPMRLRKSQIIPIARLISVADHFCDLVIANPQSTLMTPKEAIEKMASQYSDRLDKQYFEALKQLFHYEPAETPAGAP